jgi:hypothetical protein
MSLTQALEHLPISSSVYVVYATRQQRIHIVSRSVNSLYCVVKSQLEIESELMADDSAHLNQLFNSWTWQQGDDQSGFFDGVPAGSLLHQVRAGNSAPIIFDFSQPTAGGANTLIVPYERLEFNHSTLQTMFDNHRVPTLVDTNFGDLLLTGVDTLGVSIPTNPSEYIFVKIDQLASIQEHEFTNGSLFIETDLTGPLNQIELDAVRSIAVDIVRAAAASENHGAPLTQRMMDIIVSHSLSWPVVIHEHVIVE